MGGPTYGRAADAGDLPALTRLLELAFTTPPSTGESWLELGGLENVRVLREGAELPAMLMRIPMGQFFGGRSVPMLGIAAVAVAPEARGRGLARRLMQHAVQELHEEGWPISCLYPSTQALYRQIGYEQAGHRFITRIPLASIDVRERGDAVFALGDGDQPAVEACYRAFAAAHDGWLDRSAFGWAGVRDRRGERYHGFGVGAREALDGYVFLSQRVRPETGRHDLVVSDTAFRSAEAGRRLLGFLADFATIGQDVLLSGGPRHPLVWLLGQQRYTVELKNFWMLRLTDLRRALEARGYPACVRAEVSLDVADDLLPGNAGRWTARVEEGRAEAFRGGDGEVRLHVRALAALWSGFTTPRELRTLGAVEGPERALETLGALFAGGTPAMGDMF